MSCIVTGVVLYDCSILCLKIVSIAFYLQLWKQNASAYLGLRAMCRVARFSPSVNDGIVYLMVIPYVLVVAIGCLYRMRKKKLK
jgi:hypothetical protein